MSGRSAFPGWLTLVPTTGAALVIAADGRRARRRRPDRAGRPCSGSATTPTPLYLWHWPPLIALPWVLHGELGDGVRVGILAATVVLAWVTKALVEDPARTRWRRRATLAELRAGRDGHVPRPRRHDGGQRDGRRARAAGVRVRRRPGREQQAVLRRVRPRRRGMQTPVRPAGRGQGRLRQPGRRAHAATAASSGRPRRRSRCGASGPAPRHPTRTIAVVGNSFAIQLVPMLKQWIGHRPIRILLAARTECLGLTVTAGERSARRRPVPGVVGQGADQAAGHGRPRRVVFSDYPEAAVVPDGTGQARPAVRSPRRGRQSSGALRAFRRAGIPTAVVQAPARPPLAGGPRVHRDVDRTLRPVRDPTEPGHRQESGHRAWHRATRC